MMMNNTRIRVAATRSVSGGVVAIPTVTRSLGAFSGFRVHTGS